MPNFRSSDTQVVGEALKVLDKLIKPVLTAAEKVAKGKMTETEPINRSWAVPLAP